MPIIHKAWYAKMNTLFLKFGFIYCASNHSFYVFIVALCVYDLSLHKVTFTWFFRIIKMFNVYTFKIINLRCVSFIYWNCISVVA